MTRRVIVRGEKIPVRRRRMVGADGYSYKRTKSDKRQVKRRIELRANMRGARRLVTLVHEMIHQLDIGLSERTVLRLEAGIVEMVRDNPEVFYELANAES